MAKKTTSNAPTKTPVQPTVAGNRRAYHDYFIDETIEAAIVFMGTEVKSVRAGRVTTVIKSISAGSYAT